MALTSAEVQAAVDACNEAMQNIDSAIGGIDSLNVMEEIRGYADELHKVWETENGHRTMIELYKVLDSLNTSVDSLIKSANNIKNDKYTFTKTSETTYSWD